MNDVIPAGDNAPVAWDPNSGENLPAYLADALGEVGTNIPDRNTVPSLSYEGKTWSIHKDGNKTKLQSQNEDGDMVPVPIMRAVILNFNGERGRAYYPGTYNPAQSAAPTCWSADGKVPDPSVTEKQAATCAACPMAVKGSKVAEGREMVACSQHRMIAIAPAFEIDGDPLRLKIAVTSDWDKDIVEHGWFAFRQYVDYLKSRGITHTALVVTKIKFDNSVAYPKLLFALDRVLGQSEIAQATAALKNPKVEALLAEKWTAAGVNGTPSNDSDIRPMPEDPAHIHGAGTDAELWWDGDAWVKPWQTEAAEPAAPPPPSPPPAAQQPAERPKPTDPAHIHNAGQPDELWWDADAQSWVRPWGAVETAADAGFRSPEAAPAPTPEPEKQPEAPSGIAAAEADGWVKHPEADGYHYKGQEVVASGELAGRYPSGATAPTAGSAEPASTAEPQAASTSSAPAASPTDDEVPADVAALLGKWGGDPS